MKEPDIEILKLKWQIDDLFFYCCDNDILLLKYFDTESLENLNMKLEVLQSLKDGKKPIEIPNYYKILEKYPKDNQIWD